MGKGTDMARALGNHEHAAVIDTFKEQLLIVFLARLGGKVSIPVAEIDATGGFTVSLSVDFENNTFTFELGTKS